VSNLFIKVKDLAKRAARYLFEFGQYLGLDVLPHHRFYSNTPTIAELRRSEHWRRPLSLTGIRGIGLAEQQSFVASCCSDEILQTLDGEDIFLDACRVNGREGYGPIEAAFLYCFIASRHPPRVIQVGAGVSTEVILRAARETGQSIEVICIDPYPTKYLQDEARLGRIELIEQPVQLVEPELITEVGEDGLLFVDATHTVKPGSDVNYLVLEVLPRLREPSTVHFHDVTLPYDFNPSILKDDLFFWNETVLLTAFLSCNPSFSLEASLSMLHNADKEFLKKFFPWYSPRPLEKGIETGNGHYPSSAYLRFSETR